MKIRVRYKQNGAGEQSDDILGNGGEFPNGFICDEGSFPTVKCCNPLCKSTYFWGNVLSSFIRSGQESAEGYLFCHGNESSPRGRRVYRRCANSLRYQLSRVVDTPQNESE